jgi:hypothetical protein
MKHLQIRALAIVMACWYGSIAQEKPGAPAAPVKAASSSPSGVGAGGKASAAVKSETKHKAFVERRKAAETDRKKVDSHLRKIRRDRAKEAEQERAAHKEREEKGRSPIGEAKAKKDSTGGK